MIMKNIWKIFSGDLKRLITNPFPLIIALGLCAIPSLYAWFNIYANWDPYANTANVQIAVVNEDEGYQKSDGSIVNMGDEVVDSLKENNKIGWVFLEQEDEALEGVYSGDYYAAIVITSDFTYSMYNVFKEEFAGPTITYYENEKRNAIAVKITDSAVSSLKATINKQFIEVVASNIFEQTNQLSEEMQEADGFAVLEGKLTDLNDNLISYSAMIDSFQASNAALSEAVSDVNKDIPDLSQKISSGSGSITDAKSKLSSTQTTLGSFSQNVQDNMNSIQTSINQIATDIENSSLATNAQQTADSLNQTLTDTSGLISQLDELNANFLAQIETGELPADEAERLQRIIDTIGTINSGASDINAVIGTLNQENGGGTIVADTVTSYTGSITQVLNNCTLAVENMRDIYVNSLVPQMDNLISSMSQMLTNVTSLLDNLNDTLGDMSIIFDGIETTVSGTNDSLEQIQKVIDDVSARLTELLERLDEASEDEKAEALLNFLQGDPESYGEFFSQPVEVETVAVYEVENYGTAMMPFYSVLALWVGGTILVAIIKVKAEPKGLTDVKSYQLYFGRYLLFWLLGQIQAAIIVFGDLYLLKCKVQYPGLLWLTASLSSFTFTLLIYSLALSFGDVGKALAVVIMVIQIAGSGGSFPIELLPEIYQKIYIFFPFPYAINAMREALAGMYGSDYMKYLAELLIFAVAAMLIGLVIRIPFVRINHFMEERMEDTKLM
jgi:putative membrane protein